MLSITCGCTDLIMDPFPVGSKVSTNWSNTWKHACYCDFMYEFTEKHACFHVLLQLVLTFDPTGKGSIIKPARNQHILSTSTYNNHLDSAPNVALFDDEIGQP